MPFDQRYPLLLTLLLTACAGPTPAPPPAVTVFTDVTVLPMDGGAARLPGRTVLVDGGRIAALGPAAEVDLPAGARVVDGEGLFLMPGLVDMHVHNWLEQDHALFLRWGVTAIRNMAGDERHLLWRRQVAAGERLGPTIFTAGPVLDGDPPVRPWNLPLKTPEDAVEAVRRQRAAAYDFVKVYSVLRPEVFRAVLAAAGEEGLAVTGHVPLAVPLADAIAWGLGGVEHSSGFRLAMQAADSPLRELDYEGWRSLPRPELARLVRVYLDPGRFEDVVDLLCENGVVSTPTLIAGQRLITPAGELERLATGETLRFVPAALRGLWDPAGLNGSLTDDERLTLNEAQEWHRRFVPALEEAGCGVVAGTDTPGPFTLHGRSLHEELELLVDAGLEPAAALRAATARAARVLGQEETFGRVAVGLRADLVLLGSDPLDDIRATADIRGVMVRGRWMTLADLEEGAEASALFFAEKADLNPFAR